MALVRPSAFNYAGAVTRVWHTEVSPGVPGDPGDQSNPKNNDVCDRSGGDLSGNPENVVVLTANQGFALSDAINGFVYGEYVFTDERMTDVNNDPEKRDGSYDTVNLRAGLIYEPWATQVTLWGRNVFDEDATSTIADAPGQDGRLVGYFQEPATWGLTVRKDF
jgi:iron complex outermembrane receptor protein